MFLKATFLLISLIWCVQSKNLPGTDLPGRGNNPVGLFDLTNVVIEGYTGNFQSNNMELLKNVEILTLKDCKFNVSSYNVLNPLENMQVLIVTDTNFGTILNDPSLCCTKLREMKMVDSSAGPMSMEDFKLTASAQALEILYLIKMDIPAIGTNALVGSNLRKLGIDGSKLATIEDGAFNGMDKLEVLELQNNKLKNVPTTTLAAVKSLKELNLENNLFEKITAADIPSLPNLEKLSLGRNPIKVIDLKGLKEKLPKIKEINLSGINIDISNSEGLPIHKS